MSMFTKPLSQIKFQKWLLQNLSGSFPHVALLSNQSLRLVPSEFSKGIVRFVETFQKCIKIIITTSYSLCNLIFNGGCCNKYNPNLFNCRPKNCVKGHCKLNSLATDKNLKNYVCKSKCIFKWLFNLSSSLSNNEAREEVAKSN